MSTPTKIILVLIVLGLGWFAVQRINRPPIANAPPRPGPIVAFGDSLTRGYGAPDGASYPDQLSEMIGRPVMNKGVNGETIAQAAPRLQRDVLDHAPSIVLVGLGGNDLLRRNPSTEAFPILEEMVEAIIEEGALVVLIGVEGLPLLSEDFGALYKEIAREEGAIYVPDILDGLMTKPELMSDDIHPNAAGYRIMAERIAEALEGHLPPPE